VAKKVRLIISETQNCNAREKTVSAVKKPQYSWEGYQQKRRLQRLLKKLRAEISRSYGNKPSHDNYPMVVYYK
jgi:ribosome assembly protein YihI (activator of Der GTPase)